MPNRPTLLLPLLLAALGLGAAAHGQAREKIPSVVPVKAALFPLEDVRLLPSPFQQAQDTDKAYLLQLNPDSLLAWMRQTAGLKARAPHYGGWDSGGSGTVGHYLSACAQMAQATGDPKIRHRVDYVVAEMAAIQKANGDGGLYPSGWDKNWFAKLAAGQVQTMSTTPWYTTHKTLAGLRDAWLLCGNAQARNVLIKMADWCQAVTSRLTAAQWQEMLGPPGTMGEFGGPHEVLADVYAITGDRKYLSLAERFRHNVIFDPLARGDGAALNGQHANCEIPKFVGYERIYQLTGDPVWHRASQNFWSNVTGDRTWANGGNSQWEHFFDPATFQSSMEQRCGPETCNTYNMLKLTQELYTDQPSARYMDYYETALYNSILSSEAPGGGFVYYTSMRPGHYRVYSRPYDAFWCCVGTGMENHGKYGRMIYAAAPHRLYVNLFIPSALTWKAGGLTLRQDTTFPQTPRTRLTLALAPPRPLTLSLRYPGWVAPGALTINVNGAPVTVAARPGSYVDITRRWKSGDRVDVALPMRVRTEALPHSANYAAFFYGPVLLAGPLGMEGLTRSDFYGGGNNMDVTNQLATKTLPIAKFPVGLGTPAQAPTRVARVPGPALAFHTRGLAEPGDVTLIPFYQLHFQRYAIYWSFVSQAAYAQRRQQIAAEQRETQTLDARTVDRVRVGEPASEAAHHLVADRSNVGPAGAPFTHWRDATGGFRYDLKVLPDQPVSLRVAYWGSDEGRDFDVLVNGTSLATEHLTGERPDEYLPRMYPIPEALTRGKSSVTVQFAPSPGSTAGGVFDCRVVRPL